MTILDAGQVARLTHDAGFSGESLVTAVAVAKAESGSAPTEGALREVSPALR